MKLPSDESAVDLTEAQARLANATGPAYWRSLEELAGTESFQRMLHREFPDGAADLSSEESRRTFLKLMGASLALAGVSGCAIRTPEKIIPWVKSPENVVPGKPQFFATAMTIGGLSTGLLVESHQGRPTKVEGNPAHPASLGSSDTFMQAAPLNLYDPDRSQAVLHEGEVSTWDNFVEKMTQEMVRLRAKKGAGLRILSEAVGSPTLGGQIRELLANLPEAKWHRFEPVNHDGARAGAKLAFGEYVDPVYRFDKADVVVALDADFLACGAPGRTADERAFAARRAPVEGQMNRLYVAEAALTNTGATADHRLPIQAGRIVDLALALAKELGIEGAEPGSLVVEPLDGNDEEAKKRAQDLAQRQTERISKWVKAVAKDLKAHEGKSLVLVGDSQPGYVHAVGHAINSLLKNIGDSAPVSFIEPIEVDPVEHLASLKELVADAKAGKVETLVILGGNPAYSAPVDLGEPGDPKKDDGYKSDFARLLATKIPLTVRLGQHDDETSDVCKWHVPEANFLETWSDGRAFDGTASIVQPLIRPLYNGRSAHELIGVLSGQFDRQPLTVVKEHWQSTKPPGDFEKWWRKALHNGVIADSASKPKAVTAKPLSGFGAKPKFNTADFEVVFRPDPTMWDGRFANNGWLQELPKPITKLVWDNAALVSLNTANALGFKHKDQILEITHQGRTLRAPIFVVGGMADKSVVLHLGYGRWRGGQLGTEHGFSAYELQTSDAPGGAGGVKVRATNDSYHVVSTQMEHNIEGRDHVRVASLVDYVKNPNLIHEGSHHAEDSLTPLWEYDSYKWGMAIDLNSCTGCNACVIGCMAENNTPVIGKAQMDVGRNMQWLEIDTYFHSPRGYEDDLNTYFQPRLCMHCENAPCELVCPVAATVHDAEGLNVMVYNRCVGTRYCGNNCPYKVRHFNYLDYSDQVTPSLKLLNNPDVTVRSRGVMEKCTYCVQRISGQRIYAKERGERIKDGDVITACQAACPAQAIHFGNLNDPNAKVTKIKEQQRNYAMLGELNVRPRTTYLAKIHNRNPELFEA